MRVIKFLAPALLAAAALSGCVDGPISSHGGGAVALSLAPQFTFVGSSSSLPITKVRTTPYFVEGGGRAGNVKDNPVGSQNSAWTVYADVDLGGRDTATIVVEVELISTESGADVVEWSAVVGPIQVAANTTPDEFDAEVALLRGPLTNAGVESLSVHGPSFMFASTSVSAYAAVVSQGSHSVRWSSSNPDVASVQYLSGDSILVHAHEEGSAWIRAGAGFHADSFLVHVDSTATGEPAALEVVPDSAVVIVGATRAWFAFVTDSVGQPLAATPTWQSLDEAVATVSAGGVVTGVSVGRARIVASAGEVADTAIAIIELLPDGVDLVWQGGTPGAENDWFTADNWSPSRVPTTSDVIYFAGGTYPLYLDADTEVGGIRADSAAGFFLELLEHVTLTVHGDVHAPYIYGDSTTQLILAGSPSTLWGWGLPPLVIRGDVTVTEAWSYGDVTIESGATLDAGTGGYIIVDHDLMVIGAGLIMAEDTTTGDYSYVTVLGDIVFDGGDGTGNLSGGYLNLQGDFTVTDASCAAFRPMNVAVEIYTDTSTISVACSGPDGNRFWDLWIYSTGSSNQQFTLASDLYVESELYVDGVGSVAGNGFTTSMGYGSIYFTTFDRGFVEVRGSADGYFYADSLAFTNMTGETRPQLLVEGLDGCCGTWQRVEFDPTSSGPYIELNDPLIDGDSLIYYMASNPGDGPARTVTSGEAVVYWAGEPTYLNEWTGYGQTGTASQPLPDSLVVRVFDYWSVPVEGATVTWTVTDSDGSVSPVTTVTDAEGMAATQYTMGGVNYPTQEVIATVPAVADTAYFYSYTGSGLAPPQVSESVMPTRTQEAAPIDPRERTPRVRRDLPARPSRSTLNTGERP